MANWQEIPHDHDELGNRMVSSTSNKNTVTVHVTVHCSKCGTSQRTISESAPRSTGGDG